MKRVLAVVLLSLGSGPLLAATCAGLPNAAEIRSALVAASSGNIGGLFNGARMWGAVVNRDGEVCAFTTSTEDPQLVWPGSEAIAKAKAFTANAFSINELPLSTARLYTFTQPGHSLWSLGQSNLFDADAVRTHEGASGTRQSEGGLIFFGGGVPVYNANGDIIGGLGVSGDTSCADHEIAKEVRDLLSLNPPGGKLADDISYSLVDTASVITHPLCLNTFRNGEFVGNELPASGY